MTARLKRNLPLILLLLLSVSAYHQWLSFRSFFYADWVQYSHTSITHSNIVTTWTTSGIGSTNILLSRLPAQAAQYAISLLYHAGTNVTDKFVFFAPVIILLPLAGYMLSSLLTKNRWIAAIGGAVFAFNTYFLAMNFEGDEMITVAAAACLLALCMYIKALQEVYWAAFKIIVASLLLLYSSAYDFRIVYITGILMAIYTLCVSSKRSIKLFCLLGIILLGTCAFWILPLEASASLTSNAAFDRSLFGSNFWSLPAALTLFYPFWTGYAPLWFNVQQVPAFFWVIPIFVATGLIIVRRNILLFYFAIVGLLGVLLAKQVQLPFSNLYQWLYANFPGFNAFREASKFYILIAIAYSAIIVLLLQHLYTAKNPKIKYGGYAVGFVVFGLFALNLKPLFLNQLGGVLAPRHIPTAYSNLNQLLDTRGSFYRSLWLPSISPWADQTDNRPVSSSANLLGNWQTTLNTSNSEPIADQLASEVNEPISNTLATAADFKYIVVPLRDMQNNDDFFVYYGNDRTNFVTALNNQPWLKRVNFGNNDIAVYKNTSQTPYVSTSDNLSLVANIADINEIYNLSSSQLGSKGFHFAGPEDYFPATNVKDMFSSLTPSNFESGKITQTVTSTTGQVSSIYANTNHPALSYSNDGARLTIFEANPNKLSVDGKNVGTDSPPRQVTTMQIKPSLSYFIEETGETQPVFLSKSQNQSLGLALGTATLYSSNKLNLFPNPSLEAGLWQKKVSDCNDFNNQALIDMSIDTTTATNGHQSLLLTSGNHIACTGPNPITVTPGGTYILGFDYKVAVARQAGYKITFNDPAQTTVTGELSAKPNWTSFSRFITVPAKATTATIQLLGYPDQNLSQFATTNYDQLSLEPLTQLGTIPINAKPNYVKIPVVSKSTVNYTDPNYKYGNLITNPSFKEGLWQKHVSDCNNYDNNPIIAMSLDKDLPESGHNALELDATRHTACTGLTGVTLTKNAKLYLSFDYQSSDKTNAAYYIAFNDSSNTTATQQIPITDTSWHTFSTQVSVPRGATKLSLLVYSYASPSNTVKVATRYTNFQLVEMPDITGSYYLVSNPTKTLANPKTVRYSSANPDTKYIQIHGATKPFYLNVSEAYSSEWRLDVNNAKLHRVGSWVPMANVDAIPSQDHYVWDNFANGWYIDVNQLCSTRQLCTRNPNGSYDISFVAEYTPQRWLYFGFVISGLTILSCIAFTIYYFRKRHWHMRSTKYVARK